MLRRFLVILIRRSLLILLLVCLGCVAQSAPPDVARKIEHQVRAFYTIPPEVKVIVGAITPSADMPGYDGVTVNIDGGDGKQKDYKFLLSKDRGTMLRVTRFDLTKDPFAELMSKIDIAGRPSRGAKSAKVVVVNGDRVTFIYKDDPLTEIHPWALHAAVDANCLAAQNGDAYWDFADYIHANKREVDTEKTPVARFDAIDKMTMSQGQKHSVDVGKLQSCVKAQNEDAVKASMNEAEGLGVNGTPALFINGQKIDGAVPIGEVRAALDAALKDAGEPVPQHIPSSPVPASK
jgi:hypothetical protein